MSRDGVFETASVDDTEALAAALGARLRGGDLVALRGPLGAGKTAFVRGLARGLGLDPRAVSSPTFVLLQEYERELEAGTLVLAHLDAWRIETASALGELGWDELLADPSVVTCVEWADRIERALPADRIEVAIDHAPAGRRIEVRGLGAGAQRTRGLSPPPRPRPAPDPRG